MTPSDAQFLRRCLKRYYFERFDKIELPPHMRMREFGYRRPDAGMVRHLQLGDAAELRVMLLQAVPLEVFASNARYMLPDAPMGDKVWQDAHLIFDIDAKDLNLDCRASHAVFVCGKCSDTGGRCGHRDAWHASVACDACIRAAKGQVRRLLSILGSDFGVRDGVRVYFSGNEGFHVHVHDEEMAGLDSAGRADLADYLAFRGALPERFGFSGGDRPRRGEKGWRGRFAKAAKSPDMYSGGRDAFEKFVAKAAPGVRIDAGVTMDLHRIFRMPGTINGKSCMAKTYCKDVGAFNPYRDAVAMHGEPACVRASCPVRFRMNGRRFGPYKNEYVEVPAYAAAYMICKGVAHAAG